MYPPLDDYSNSIGGKGTTGIQDALVGKRWEGSDVPASIIEAGQLFSTHVKTTRAMRQLWEERERFMRYDRGWNADDAAVPDDLDLTDEVTENLEDLSLLEKKKQPQTSWSSEKQTDDEDVQRRLDTVESFYVSFDQEKEVQKLNTYSYADGCPGLSPVDHYCLFEDHFDQR